MKHVVVIGGGIAGLAAAHRLTELAREDADPIQVTLLERSGRVGGPIETVCERGFVIECGADSFISEKPWALALARRLGLEAELIPTGEMRRTMIVCRGRLTDIPAGFNLLAPINLLPMFKSPILSLRGKLRLALELMLPRRVADADESIAGFVTRRMGREVLERLAQPLAAGIYTGDPAALSIEATLPRFAELESHYGSVIRGLKEVQKKISARDASGARWSLFLSFKGGMQTIIDALARELGGAIRLETGVQSLTAPAPHTKWRVALREGTVLEADGVICAARAGDAAGMVESFDGELGASLRRIEYSSAATVTLAYQESDFPQTPRSFGFVVPAAERRKIIAGSFSSVKFAGRAPDGCVLMRVFMGGVLQKEVMALGDDEMVATAREEITALLGVNAAPILTRVARWVDSMPQYAVGHLSLVAEIEQRAAKLEGFALAGAAYRGVGVPDCVHSGEQAAEAVWSWLHSSMRQSAA
ncbi:MAG TPA: protoporphyrinogen oxidase [Candidatus Binataceae bacterium]|jgi:oxygen-dependent protoporphyrinogen oxidase|nr:protoporphyrinogen oxidase [Candidatus Binataceae bacterium]